MQARNCRCGAVWCEARRACSTSPNNWSHRPAIQDPEPLGSAIEEALRRVVGEFDLDFRRIMFTPDIVLTQEGS
jgi:hypothetical protein